MERRRGGWERYEMTEEKSDTVWYNNVCTVIIGKKEVQLTSLTAGSFFHCSFYRFRLWRQLISLSFFLFFFLAICLLVCRGSSLHLSYAVYVSLLLFLFAPFKPLSSTIPSLFAVQISSNKIYNKWECSLVSVWREKNVVYRVDSHNYHWTEYYTLRLLQACWNESKR